LPGKPLPFVVSGGDGRRDRPQPRCIQSKGLQTQLRAVAAIRTGLASDTFTRPDVHRSMDNLHDLVRRQWHRYLGRDREVTDELRPFIRAVSDAYREFDTARQMVERALAVSSGELHAAKAEFRGVLQALPDWLFRVGPDGQIHGVMEGSQVADHPALRARGNSPTEEPAADARAFRDAIEQARLRQIPISFEYTRGADEHVTCYEVRLLPFVGHDIIGVMRDITERKRAEIALQESKERLALAQRAGRVGAFEWDVESGRVFWSAESQEIFGVPQNRPDKNQAAWRECLVPEDRVRLETCFQTWFASGREDEQWEYRIIRPDRQERHIESRGRVFRAMGGKVVRVVGTNLDITARKQAEQDRLVLGKLESTGVLAGGTAHDFNNLLTSILLNLDLVQSATGSPERVAEHLATARSNVAAAQLLTQQLITFARGGTAARRPMHLGAVLKESVALALSGANVRAEIFVSPDLLPAEVDAAQISQVLRNLVLNAREAMPDGGVIFIRAENLVLNAGNPAALPPGNYVRVQVEDHGAGIPAEILPKIFDPYFSTKNRGEQKGMGLGLTIAHSVLQRHAGAVTVDSAVGKGTRFEVYLPAVGQLPAISTIAPIVPATAPARAGRILVMDDELIVREVCLKVLRQLGYEAVAVPEGSAAVELYARAQSEGKPFDAVFLDLTVKGGMGGKEASELLLAADPGVRMVVMSGYSEDDVVREHQRHGFKAALPKPFDRDSLRSALTLALSG
jgi:PAS domain S-box-containing protein